jgi:hypothetical protein
MTRLRFSQNFSFGKDLFIKGVSMGNPRQEPPVEGVSVIFRPLFWRARYREGAAVTPFSGQGGCFWFCRVYRTEAGRILSRIWNRAGLRGRKTWL